MLTKRPNIVSPIARQITHTIPQTCVSVLVTVRIIAILPHPDASYFVPHTQSHISE